MCSGNCMAKISFKFDFGKEISSSLEFSPAELLLLPLAMLAKCGVTFFSVAGRVSVDLGGVGHGGAVDMEVGHRSADDGVATCLGVGGVGGGGVGAIGAKLGFFMMDLRCCCGFTGT